MDTLAGLSGLPRSFFARSATDVARALLGQVVVHVLGDVVLAARIVETEAYLDERDAASHARFGRTARNASMFGPPGIAYVYLIYGLHTMLNVVTGAEGAPQAVLLRAAEPMVGTTARMDGPGRLARALRIQRHDDGADLCAGFEHGRLAVLMGEPPAAVAAGPRVGVACAGSWRDAPLRFVDPASRAVSPPKAAGLRVISPPAAGA